MKRPLRTLPIVEKWDCNGCSHCCRGTTILLDKDDLAKLARQKWDQHPDFRGVKTVVRESLLGGRKVLAKQSDGSCIFLASSGRCRIHESHGADAKPAVCRMYPLQLVSLERQTNLTVRFGCPTAAEGQGSELSGKVKKLQKSKLTNKFLKPAGKSPFLTKRVRRDWSYFERIADTLAGITTDTQLPLVRRLVHGLRFCDLLEECKLSTVDDSSFDELTPVLQTLAPEGVGDLFFERQSPTRATAFLFRQAALHFIRSHPRYPDPNDLAKRIRLAFATMKLARGHGKFPDLHPEFPATTFKRLETPLGPLSNDVLAPLERYFVSNVHSRHYAIHQPSRPLLDCYRNLVLAYPMALWLLRLVSGSRPPNRNDMIDVVGTIDRAQGTLAISKSANIMAKSGGLERLVAWYGR